eukprot:9966081-Alexandrium_andersonii.AAC.1
MVSRGGPAIKSAALGRCAREVKDAAAESEKKRNRAQGGELDFSDVQKYKKDVIIQGALAKVCGAGRGDHRRAKGASNLLVPRGRGHR